MVTIIVNIIIIIIALSVPSITTSKSLLALFFSIFLLLAANTSQRDDWLCRELNRRPTGCRDGAVVRALASHQYGPGSIPRLSVICGLTLKFLSFPDCYQNELIVAMNIGICTSFLLVEERVIQSQTEDTRGRFLKGCNNSIPGMITGTFIPAWNRYNYYTFQEPAPEILHEEVNTEGMSILNITKESVSL